MSRPALSLFRHPRSLLGQRIARPGSGGHRAGSGSALRRWRDGGTSTQTPEAERRKHLQTRCLATTHRRAQRQKQKQRSRGGGGERAGPGRPKRSGGQPHRRRREEPELAIRPPRNYMKKLPKPSEQETAVPPVFLAPTASPFVYVSKAALGDDYANGDSDGDDDDGDDDDPEPPLDPSTLFSEVYHPSTGAPVPPPLFAQGEFSYFSPKKDLGYEYPKHGAPEVAFLGRSNVGKSSLINALVRKPLCLASRVPGRTRLPHYLGLVPRGGKGPAGGRPDPALVSGFLVDLPGYGYARAPAHASEAWQADTQDLLLQRFHGEGVLKRVFLLVDARRGGEGPSENDRFVLRWLEDAGLPYTVVLTKADRVAVEAVVRQANDFCLRHASFGARGGGAAQSPVVHVTSAAKGWGIHELMLSVEAEFLGGG